jgi:type II secretory pathway component PulF
MFKSGFSQIISYISIIIIIMFIVVAVHPIFYKEYVYTFRNYICRNFQIPGFNNFYGKPKAKEIFRTAATLDINGTFMKLPIFPRFLYK